MKISKLSLGSEENKMSPAIFIVPDEWLIYDLCGENNEEKQREALLFLEKVMNKCDKLAIRWGSPFVEKAYKLLMSSSNHLIRVLSKFFYENFLYNSDKCRLLYEVEELPENLKEKIPDEEDFYLFETLRSIPGSILVTTDEKLCYLSTALGVSIYFRDEFLTRLYDP